MSASDPPNQGEGAPKASSANAEGGPEATACQEDLELLLEAVHDAAYLFDVVRDDEGEIVDFLFTYVNSAAEVTLGSPREALLGQRLCELHPFHKTTSLFRDYVRVFERGEPLRREFEVPGLPSGPIWYRQHVSATPRGIAIAGRNITTEKLADQASRDIEQRAQRAQNMESLGMLAGGVAHDFNNLLLAIGGFAELALMSKADTPEPVHQSLLEIQKATQRAAGLTRQLLTFGNRQSAAPRPLEINRLIEDCRPLLERLMMSSEIKLVTHLVDEPLTVIADEVELTQVLVNLCVNARDAMPSGGEFTIATECVSLDASLGDLVPGAPAGRYARITVSDSGFGMDELTRSRVFEPFFTTKDVGAGTGLGLALVYSIVSRHGGHVDVLSAPARGTTFRIDLPLGGRLARVAPASDPAAAVTGQGVLVVDDEISVRVLVGAALESAGYRPWMASGGAEAVRMFRDHQDEIELVILDVVMPGMNGRQTYEALCQIDPDVRVLFSTGFERDVFPPDFFRSGEHALLRKPYGIPSLLRAVQAVLER